MGKCRWNVEVSQRDKDVVQYYIKSPPCFYLVLLVAARNVVLEDNTLMMDSITKESRAALARENPEAEYPDEMFANPGLVASGHPICVRISPRVGAPFEYIIGRSQQNLDEVPANARRWFSRRHCAIQAYCSKRGQTVFALRDLKSANGTFLNGKPLATGGTAALLNDDVIGVSMTDSGGLMLGFRFMVVTEYEQSWPGSALPADPPPQKAVSGALDPPDAAPPLASEQPPASPPTEIAAAPAEASAQKEPPKIDTGGASAPTTSV